jgi:ERCC4-related helicase
MSLLPSHPWRISYSSNENNPITDFYIPALECAIKYDRRSGFFNSAILSRVARGLGAMLHNNGRMRLIMGCQFSPQDLAAIKKGYALREAIAHRLEEELKTPQNFIQLKHFEILSWLIAEGFLEIKIAIPLKDGGLPDDLDTNHLFHEKSGIFTDREGNQIAFNGFNNESVSGWEQNVESFHVYCSWEGGRDLERVNEEQYRFEQLWNDFSPNVKVFAVPEAVKQKLLHYLPARKPEWSKQIEYDERPLQDTSPSPRPEEINLFRPLLDIGSHEGCLDYCLKSIPITPWIHQLKILRQMIEDYPRSAIICDEVGLGKTISTGLLVRYLLISQTVQRVLILVPASVQSQWHEELREKFNLHFWSYDQGKFLSTYGESYAPTGNPWNSQTLILASSHLVRRSDRATELLEADDWDLIILDEAHHARRRSPQAREDTPNRLLGLMRQLREKSRSLLLLTATPMQIDTIEVFDLLSLLGLKGQWQYQDNFCDYFASLPQPPERSHLEFWQKMSTDYFRTGGLLCPLLEKHFANDNRMMLYRLKDIWQQGREIANIKQLCTDRPFVEASRQFLTVHTPLKDLMFRHTRDTLREYYRCGILERDVPKRLVFDQAIALDPVREVHLYQAVSDYVRHFYNLAQQESRQGLGFLMTLYRRRLTSSFYAIRKSLERRLEGISLTEDDLGELDNADDPVIAGLESYMKPTDPAEIEYLENLLQLFENTGEDSKLSHFLTILRQELIERESAIAFFQYTDTMDYVRDTLVQIYGHQVACYSGRGGELYEGGNWRVVKKEQIKWLFREGQVKILLCTKSASEGLNLQTCGVILMYSMPWNPMQVEQQIGRLDRIGQIYPSIRIHNFFYDGTVEAKVYCRLRERINAFETVVGNLQPILAQMPTFIERAAMAADPEEEGVLLAQLDGAIANPPLRPNLEAMVTMSVESDVEYVRGSIALSPITCQQTEELFTHSHIFPSRGVEFIPQDQSIWQVKQDNKTYTVTFYPEVFDEFPSLRLMSMGEPLFEHLLQLLVSSRN